jgi:RNA polymerase sigma factor (sigma-70 family)
MPTLTLTPDQWALVEGHRALARRHARLVAGGSCWDEFEDFVQAGMMGLINAAARYDRLHLVDGHPVAFSTFARPFIAAEMVDHLNARLPGPRHAKEHAARLRKRGVDPLSPDVLPEDHVEARARGMCADTVADRRRIAAGGCPVSLETKVPPAGGDSTLYDTLIDPAPPPDVLAEQRWTKEQVRAAVLELPIAQRLAVIFHEFGGMTMVETARELEVSVPALRALLQGARAALRERLADLV